MSLAEADDQTNESWIELCQAEPPFTNPIVGSSMLVIFGAFKICSFRFVFDVIDPL